MSVEPVAHRVRVDAGSCVSTGFCVASAPQVFALDAADGHARVVTGRVTDGGTLELVQEAEQMCPVGAVTVEPDRHT